MHKRNHCSSTFLEIGKRENTNSKWQKGKSLTYFANHTSYPNQICTQKHEGDQNKDSQISRQFKVRVFILKFCTHAHVGNKFYDFS